MSPGGDLRGSCEKSIRQAPLASVLAAFFAGVVFRIVPVFAIVGGLLRLARVLVRPTLLVFGVAKAAELVRERGRY